MLAREKVHQVTVLDTLENGFKQAIPADIHLVQGSTGDKALLEDLFNQEHFDAVIHFAAYLSVEESVREPIKYMKNNLIEPLALLATMEEFSTKYLIFSSTAAVYGYPTQLPIPEDHLKKPESPYGLSKLAMEHMLRIYDRQDKIRSIALRYFNASGADVNGNFGEAHQPETHLVPLAIQTALGKRESLSLFGTDYQTRDGSCERDYIHIEDLCQAHLMALDALANGHPTDVYNVATGHGITNKELIAEVKKQTGNDFSVVESARRPGDPHILVADPSKIQTDLGWKANYSDIETIITSALKWHTSHPDGYSQ
jgi:UDP-glucose 4-epimerase